MILTAIEIIILICAAGFFDSTMDAIRDFKQSDKFWLWKWVQKHPAYMGWYMGWHSLPFFESRGWVYKAGCVLLADRWHTSKHLMLLSWAGAVACAFGTHWYFQIAIWWTLYFVEGEAFNYFYQRLKD